MGLTKDLTSRNKALREPPALPLHSALRLKSSKSSHITNEANRCNLSVVEIDVDEEEEEEGEEECWLRGVSS